MKLSGIISAFLLGAWLLSHSIVTSNAQSASITTQNDSVVAVVAESEGLSLLAPEDMPPFGTFWEARNTYPFLIAPMPCPPLEPYPTYVLSDGIFLVDETGGEVLSPSGGRAMSTADASSLVQQQVDELTSFIEGMRDKLSSRSSLTMSTMDELGPPAPGDGDGGTNIDYGGSGYSAPVYTTNDLWMEVGLTNSGSASLLNIVIHPPTWDTNLIYDVMLTTNLTTATLEGALNATNWFWVGQTLPGQTNIQVDTSSWPDMGFIRLGNAALDPDGDGLSTAVELLCSHSDPALSDTDGDGFSDGWEFMNNMNPRVDDSVQSGSRANFIYDSGGWLRQVSGARSESMTVDNEGNVSQ